MRYRTIVADPPWEQKAGPGGGEYVIENGVQVWDRNRKGPSLDLPYPTMSLDGIRALPVSALAEDDAHLYVWVTNKYLPDVFGIIDAWGFRYSTTLVWCKKAMGGGLGGKFGVTTEFLIHATRGSLAAIGRVTGTWFDVKRPYDARGKPMHSAKPEHFLDLVEQVSPGPRLEMFARRNRLGWDTWGNEALNHVDLGDAA